MLDWLFEIDRQVLLFLNNLGSETYDPFWQTITKFPPWIPLYLIIIALVFWKNSLDVVVKMLVSIIALLLILQSTVWLTKQYFSRLRPNNDETINQLIRVVNEPYNYSFFSGHAAFSFGLTTMVVLLLYKKLPAIHFIWIFPLLFSYSRIYLGVHYPSDILVGAIVGVTFAFIFFRMCKKLKVLDRL